MDWQTTRWLMLTAVVIETGLHLLKAVKNERETGDANKTDGVRHQRRRCDVLASAAVRDWSHHVWMTKVVELFECDVGHWCDLTA